MIVIYYIYKITNLLNGKFYIGKTTKTITERFNRHIYDAENKLVKTHLANAIVKYGKDNFDIEIIDTAENINELNQKEIYWICNTDATHLGYNLTSGGDGGNTYQYKTDAEMKLIKQALKDTKMGGLNPSAIKIKCKNVYTDEELHFDSLSECQNYFKENEHNFITRRCLHKTKYLYKGVWIIAYENDEYITDYRTYKNNWRSKEIIATSTKDNKPRHFNSFAEAERYYGLKPKQLSSKAYKHKDENEWFVKGYKICVLE